MRFGCGFEINVLGFVCVAGCWILNFGRDELVLLLCEKNWFSVYVVRVPVFFNWQVLVSDLRPP